MNKSITLSIIIVSYNTSTLTLQTVNSIFFSLEKEEHSFLRKADVDVIVVDNHSVDGSIAALEKEFGTHIRILKNDENVGFARANNQGVKEACGQFVMLLNSDTVVHPGTLDTMVKTLQERQDVGIVAASLHNLDGTYQAQGGALPTLVNAAAWWLWPLPGIAPFISPYQDSREPISDHFWERGWVGGTAMMLRKDLYENVGGLDENIFMYAEDIDLCFQVHEKKLKILISLAAWVTHIGNASGSSTHARLGEIRGLLYVFSKHKPQWQGILLSLVLVVGSCQRYLLFGILRMNREARIFYGKVLRLSLS